MLCKVTHVQDAFWLIPGLISCAGVTGRWGLLSHAQDAVKWLALSVEYMEAPQITNINGV